MTLKFSELIKSDLYRYHGNITIGLFIKSLLFNKGFKFSFWMRLAKHYDSNPLLRFFPKFMFSYYKRVFVSDINYRADIGEAFCIRHVFATTFGENVVIGRNFTIVHSVTIAGKNGHFPVIGDNVYLGAGSCVLGGITIGNNVVVGANAVVTKDIPDNAVVVGNPSKIISYKGSSNSIENKYEGTDL
ncbi:serine O-acetyltransferase [Colwellia echini]|uniref:Serine acetyltransferase n=1 Tax=Colwellia echini TaxID=1982103 RepID=A0ABY3MU83_9GAMM|nr:DapH/DapD/GlmU-related protein [Colwellia echini]TYK64778.1 serine acetyltransferase [Colwellia echini]